ncbi:MAG: phosphatidylglycerophosphatase A [Psychrobacter glaciei]|jgi:phosphatidylglycerophosphatase A|uniref:phosphatidylglycerophosphatase A family protein n=1 Tax=Psychrobacter glaciei TaxID=619771 RepID=UPI0039E53F74
MTDHDLSKPDISKANDCPPLPVNASLLDRVVYWLGIGLGSGLPRRAPGTWGSVGGLIVAIPLMSLGFVPFLIITILSCLIGIWICGRTSELMQGHDDPHIVWDEWAGIWITLLPFSYMGVSTASFWQDISQNLSIIALIIAFVLFRFFDIIKPPPIGWADKKVAGGLGIMLDDIIAGVMAAVVWLVVMLGMLL